MYSYSKTKGLFGGISLEGSVIVERQDANATAYQADVSAKQLLSGAVAAPEWASPLIKTLEACTGMPGGRKWINDGLGRDSSYAFGGVESPRNENGPSYLKKKSKSPKSTPDGSKYNKRTSYFSPSAVDAEDTFDPFGSNSVDPVPKPPSMNSWDTHFDSDFNPDLKSNSHKPSFSLPGKLGTTTQPPFMAGSQSYTTDFSTHTRSTSSPLPKDMYFSTSTNSHSVGFGSLIDVDDDNGEFSARNNPLSSSGAGRQRIETRPELSGPLMPNEGVARAIALFDFNAVESGDLSFSKGDVIVITKKSYSADDW
jgi:hypothetical protein